MGGAFQPTNLALYGYGHQNPATLADPDGADVATETLGYATLATAFFAAAAIKAQQMLNSITGRSKTPPPPPAVDPGIATTVALRCLQTTRIPRGGRLNSAWLLAHTGYNGSSQT